MNRIEREQQTVRRMIGLYCRYHLKRDKMSEEYVRLTEYACRRLEHCRFGERKKTCKKCPVHCYAPKERRRIQEIMRWVGPRMILYAPKDAIIHIWRDIKSAFSPMA